MTRTHATWLATVRTLAAALCCGGALLALSAQPGAAQAQAAGGERLALSDQALGHRVYMAYCATCHGRTGKGDGPEADGFAQPATDFTQGLYKFRSTVGEVPAPGDLERSIRVGMPGTEMVPFARVLKPESITAVAAYIRKFNADLADPDAKAEADDAVEIAAQRPFPRTAESIAAGKEVWADQGCADCHEEDGRGTHEETDEAGRPVFMVPFQWGFYKSGPADADLYRSIAAGMKGTTMDAYRDEMEPEDLWKLVDFIRSLDRREGQTFFGTVWDFFLRTNPAGYDYSAY